MNQNSLGSEQPPGLEVNQPLSAQDAFQPIPGLISCTGVLYHAQATQMAGLRSPQYAVYTCLSLHVHVEREQLLGEQISGCRLIVVAN